MEAARRLSYAAGLTAFFHGGNGQNNRASLRRRASNAMYMARGSVADLVKDSLNDVFDPNTKWPDREVEEVSDREGGESSGSDSSESDSSSPSLSDEDEEDDDIKSMEEGGVQCSLLATFSDWGGD